jgi:hypothetical protein
MNENKKYVDENKKYLSEPNISNGLKIFLAGCTLAGVVLATYFIKNPGITHPKKPIEYKIVNSIPDLNKDGIPELEVKYKNNNSIDTLLSRIENNQIIYKP